VDFKENTYVWEADKNHSGWKALSNYPTGYVIAGSKFFQAPNTDLYVTGFNDFSQPLWTVTHHLAPLGFTVGDTYWKSIAPIGAPANPSGFFIATTGTRMGAHSYYTLQTDKSGQKVLDHFGELPENITFGGACQAVNGGFIVSGGDNMGKTAVVKFSSTGELEWNKTLPYNAFGWSIQPSLGGGYVIAGTVRVTHIDADGNDDWSTPLVLPPTPMGDMSSYTYTELEEILPLKNAGVGFVVTGSAFSNTTSAAYSARFNWDGTVPWTKINDAVNTSLPGTPVAWAGTAVEYFTPASNTWDILYTWRNGPVSTGGTIFFSRMNPPNGNQLQGGSFHNAIPLQQGFTVQSPFVNRVTVAGIRGSYDAAYSYTREDLP
jgi:hypothetical protein